MLTSFSWKTYINETSEKLLVPDLCFSKQEPKALEKVFRMVDLFKICIGR